MLRNTFSKSFASYQTIPSHSYMHISSHTFVSGYIACVHENTHPLTHTHPHPHKLRRAQTSFLMCSTYLSMLWKLHPFKKNNKDYSRCRPSYQWVFIFPLGTFFPIMTKFSTGDASFLWNINQSELWRPVICSVVLLSQQHWELLAWCGINTLFKLFNA